MTIKKHNNFNIYNVPFLKKNKTKKNTCRYHYQNLDDMIYRSWDIKQNRVKLVILGHSLPFYPPKNPKNHFFFKNEKNSWRYYSFTHVYQTLWSYVVRFLRYDSRRTDRPTEKVRYRSRKLKCLLLVNKSIAQKFMIN